MRQPRLSAKPRPAIQGTGPLSAGCLAGPLAARPGLAAWGVRRTMASVGGVKALMGGWVAIVRVRTESLRHVDMQDAEYSASVAAGWWFVLLSWSCGTRRGAWLRRRLLVPLCTSIVIRFFPYLVQA